MFYAARQFSRASSVTSQSSYYPESSDIDDYEDSSEALDDAIRFSEVTDSQSETPTPNKRRSYHEYQHHQFQVHSGSFFSPYHCKQRLNSGMDCECCCCEQPISTQKLFYFYFIGCSQQQHSEFITKFSF